MTVRVTEAPFLATLLSSCVVKSIVVAAVRFVTRPVFMAFSRSTISRGPCFTWLERWFRTGAFINRVTVQAAASRSVRKLSRLNRKVQGQTSGTSTANFIVPIKVIKVVT